MKYIGKKTHLSGHSTAKALPRIKYSQAARILNKFGGPHRLFTLLKSTGHKKWALTTIYRWVYAKEKGGTGGYIPSRDLEFLLKYARLVGVLLDDRDFFPGFLEIEKPTIKGDEQSWLEVFVRDKRDDFHARAVFKEFKPQDEI